jgi:hypothetical protein
MGSRIRLAVDAAYGARALCLCGPLATKRLRRYASSVCGKRTVGGIARSSARCHVQEATCLLAQPLSNCEQAGEEMNAPTTLRTRKVVLPALLSVAGAGVAVAVSADTAKGDSEGPR